MEIYHKLNIKLNKDIILERLEGNRSNLLKEEMGSNFERLLPYFLEWISPECRIETEREAKKAYVLLSLGNDISEKIAQEMSAGRVMDSLLLDAMADTYLFQMDSFLNEIAKETFAEMKVGVDKRLEPGVDIPLEEQLTILQKVKTEEDYIDITKGYMFKPVKTFGYILELTENKETFRMQHDCRKCNNLQCKMRGKLFLEENKAGNFSVIVNSQKKEVGKENEILESPFQIAVDLGTTTIAMELLSGEKAVPVRTYTAINSCRVYGMDVITRIQNANSGGLRTLQRTSQKDLLQGIKALCEEAKISVEDIKRIGIAGNTTVTQILLGQSLEGLAAYPFEPATKEIQRFNFSQVFESEEGNAEIILFPSISGFVGGDIVAGLYQCGFLNRKRPAMLIDMGTNGEMVVGDGRELLCTSVAAGPAFEGGGLQWGVGSVSGAISGFELNKNMGKIQTIHEKTPIGICGTGMVEILSELKDARILNKEGNLQEPYLSEGYQVATSLKGEKICIHQQDIRELQLAKAAIGAGIELLLKSYGKTYREIPEVFVAGGFGYRMNVRKAVNIGIFPREFLGKIKTVGNTSLAGVESYLRDEEAEGKLEEIVGSSKELVLANTEEFEEIYLKGLVM